MSNPYYTPTGNPSTGAAGASSTMRSEFAAVEAGFDKFPALTGNTLKYLRVNSGETAVEAVDGTTLLSQNIAFAGDISPSQITTNQNDYNPTGLSTAAVLRLSTDASRNITGLAGGADGRVIIIANVGSFNIVLTDSDTNSTAANRFDLSGDYTLQPSQVVVLLYDSTSSRWRAVGQVSLATIGAAASGANTDITSVYLNNTGLKVKDTDASHGLSIVPGSNLTADRTLTVTTGDASRTLTLGGDVSVDGAASQSQQETGSSTTTFVTPNVQHYHQSALKAWISFNGTGTPAVRGSYNMDGSTPITDNGTGDFTLNIGTDFSGVTYVASITTGRGSAGGASGLHTFQIHNNVDPTAGALRIQTLTGGSVGDHEFTMVMFAGDQA